jgi:hypothetical protein
MYVLLIVVCPFVLFLLAIVLSVLLRYTDSDYPFGIFKLFLQTVGELRVMLCNYVTDEIKKKSSPLKPLSQSQLNFAEIILGWSPFKIVSVSAVLYPRWPP